MKALNLQPLCRNKKERWTDGHTHKQNDYYTVSHMPLELRTLRHKNTKYVVMFMPRWAEHEGIW